MPRFALPVATLAAAVATATGCAFLAVGALPDDPAVVTTNPDVHTSDDLWPAVYTYDQALVQCHELSVDDTMLQDCIDAAAVAWPEEAMVND